MDIKNLMKWNQYKKSTKMLQFVKDLKKMNMDYEYIGDDGEISRLKLGPFTNTTSENKKFYNELKSLCDKHDLSIWSVIDVDSMARIMFAPHRDNIGSITTSYFIFNVQKDDWRKYRLDHFFSFHMENDEIFMESDSHGNPSDRILFLRNSTFVNPDFFFEHQDKMYHCLPEMIEKAWHPSRFEKWCF